MSATLINYVRSHPKAFYDAEVLMDNKSMLHRFESMGFTIRKRLDAGVYELRMSFK